MTSAMNVTTDDGVRAEACHVCGIVRADHAEVPRDESLVPDDTEFRVVRYGDLAAIVAMVDPNRTFGRRADLMAHSGVLNALAAAGVPVIPVRFGSVLTTSEDVAGELLRPHEDRWSRMLDEFQGSAQFTLRGTYVQERLLAEIVEAHPDVAALREQTINREEPESYSERVKLGELVAQAVEERRTVDVERVRAALEPHCTATRATPGAGLDGLVDAALLVADEERQALEAAAERLAEEMDQRATFKLLGPLAPFDFVDEG